MESLDLWSAKFYCTNSSWVKHIYLVSVHKSSELASATSLKKHRSLEDLQTNGIREEEEEASNSTSHTVKSSGKTVRGCGANESFRAAIDRSYDPAKTDTVDTGTATFLCLHFLFIILLCLNF